MKTRVSEEMRQCLLSGGTVTGKSRQHGGKRVIIGLPEIEAAEACDKAYTDLGMRDQPPAPVVPCKPTPASPTPAQPSTIRQEVLGEEDAQDRAEQELHLEGFESKGELVEWAGETYGLVLKTRDTRSSIEAAIIAYYADRLRGL